MKNFMLSLSFLLLGMATAFAQVQLVDDAPPCVQLGGTIAVNVLSNDINLPNQGNYQLIVLQDSPCFYIDQEGNVILNPQASADCCGEHQISYTIGNSFGLVAEPATLTLCIECSAPDCAVINLEDYLHPSDGTNPGGEGDCISVCENSVSTLFVPYNINNTYAWTALAGATGVVGSNPAEFIVTWGAAGNGVVLLDITDANNVTSSFTFCFDIMAAPVASFTGPTYICLGQNVCFTNTTTGGDFYFWDFGDGGTSNLENPCYTYTTPGTYTVTLCASNLNFDDEGNPLCSCTHCVTMEIVVDPLPGPSIYCISTLCEGDSACYWTDATNCSSYVWTVTDALGNPIPFTGQGTDQICVTWGAGPFGTITLDVSGCDQAYCNNPTTVNVPIISAVSTITGPAVVCEFATETYSLPKWMSVLYDWTVTGGTILSGDSTNVVTIQWGPAGVGTIHVAYCSEFLEGLPGHDAPDCCGTASLTVLILPEFSAATGQSQVCVNTTSFVSATSFPFSSYNWTISPAVPFSGQGTANISINWLPGMAGTYIITATPSAPGQYCNTTDVVVITVHEVDPADGIDGPLSVCANQPYYYTALSSTPGVSFQWVATNGSPASGTGTTIGITWGTGGGTLTLYQVMNSQPFCLSDPVTITVTEKQPGGPFTITGTANCTNTQQAYTLSPAPHPDATINWYVVPSTSGSIVGGQGTTAPTVQWNNTPGLVSLVADLTLCNTVTPISQSFLLVSPQVPVIVQNGNICPGGGGTLNATAGYVSYQWSTGNTTPVTPVTAGGLYSLVTVDNNNCQATTYFNASATPGPIAAISSPDNPVICVSNPHTVTMFAQFNPNYSVQWFCNNNPVAGPGPVYNYQHIFQNNPTTTYTYHIVVTDVTTGCTNTSLPFQVTESSCPPLPGCNPPACALFPSAVNQTPYCNVVDFAFTACPGFILSNWAFGDLSLSGSPAPSHTYAAAGCYNATVCGTVPGIDPVTGLPCAAPYCENIGVCVPIAADFDWTAGTCSTMSFTDMSTIIQGPGNNIASWSWTFCDMSNNVIGTSSLQNPTFNFPGPGSYSVKLVVCNSHGCCAQQTQVITVPGVGTPVITINPMPACTGVPLWFSATATNAVSYFWSFGDGATFTGVNPQHAYLLPNTYTVTVVATDPYGCSSTGVATVLVYPPVAPATITGTTVVCQGQTTTLCAPAGYSYVWTPGNLTTQCISVGQGTYGVTIQDNNGCELDLAPVEVVELPLPNATIAGPAVICDAGCVMLSVPYDPGNTYQWLDDNLNPIPFEIYSQIFVCDFNLLPAYSVVVTDQNGCSVTSAPHTVTLEASPVFTISISPVACAGQPVTLTITPVDPNVNYTWSNGATGTSIVVSQAGTYTATGTNSNTGCSGTASATIHPLPDFCIVPQGCYEVCNPDTVCGPSGLASYQWNLNGNPIPGETGICLEITQAGTYTLTGTTVNGCTDTSADLVLTVIDCDSLPCDDIEVSFAFPLDEEENPDSCCFVLSYTNNFGPLQGLSISTADADLNVNLGSINPLLTVQSITANTLQLASSTLNAPIPQGILAGFVEICLTNVVNSPQTIVIDWYDFENAVVCSDTIVMHCPAEPDCAYVANDTIFCEEEEIVYQFTLCNPADASFSVSFINLLPSSPVGIIVTPPFIDISGSPLQPGDCQTFSVTLSGAGIAGQDFCYHLIAHETNPLESDSLVCCSLDTTYCIEIPFCDPCVFTDVISVTPSEEDGCCYDITLINGNAPGLFTSIGVNVISPATTLTVNNPFGSGWTTSGFNGTSATFLPGPLFGNTVPTGTFPIPQLCIQTNVAPTQLIEITWNQGEEVVCRDTVEVFCEPPCGYIKNDLAACSPVAGQWLYSGVIHNTSGYTVTHAVFNFFSPGGLGAYDVTVPLGAVLPNTDSPPFSLALGAPAAAGDVVCFTVTLQMQNDDGTSTSCCYFEHCITLPECAIDEEPCACDDEFYLAVAQGITYSPASFGIYTYNFQLTAWGAFGECDIVKWKWGYLTPITSGPASAGYTHVFPGPGIYEVCVKVARTTPDGTVCTEGFCITVVIPLQPAGMAELSDRLTLYPNPSEGLFRVDMQDVDTWPVQIGIYNSLQQPVRFINVPEMPRHGVLEIDLSHCATGMYYVHFIADEVRAVRPVVIR